MPYTGEKRKEYQREWARNLPEDKKAERLKKAREWKANNKTKVAAHKKDYRKYNLKGFIGRVYTNMLKRTKGKCKNPELYFGLPILSRHEFLEWALNSSELLPMWDAWKAAGCVLTLRPTINRLEYTKGYTIDNIEWMTFTDNCALAGTQCSGNQFTGRKRK